MGITKQERKILQGLAVVAALFILWFLSRLPTTTEGLSIMRIIAITILFADGYLLITKDQ